MSSPTPPPTKKRRVGQTTLTNWFAVKNTDPHDHEDSTSVSSTTLPSASNPETPTEPEVTFKFEHDSNSATQVDIADILNLRLAEKLTLEKKR